MQSVLELNLAIEYDSNVRENKVVFLAPPSSPAHKLTEENAQPRGSDNNDMPSDAMNKMI